MAEPEITQDQIEEIFAPEEKVSPKAKAIIESLKTIEPKMEGKDDKHDS
jgi:hypothetical protein